ncbi:hypothetical protein [Actinoplanes subtropicus]|uniref:hypothetical protein n=1 Tax=Actinoplanes subtropicus TaxID=543632 RepID=UPI0012FCF944|nr:hypothetical protein [Actinoplanes subtropicus]
MGEDFDEFVRARSTGLLRVAYLLMGVRGRPRISCRRCSSRCTCTGGASAAACPRPTRGGPWYGDPYGYHTVWNGDWNIRGATPDGRRFVVRTLSMDGDTRAFYFLGGPQPHFAGVRQSYDRPSVIVDLPGKQGVVVAMLNAAGMQYGPGLRSSVRGDTALLPAGTNSVAFR